MNTQKFSRNEVRADALGTMVALRLTEGAETLPHDISERLRASRVRAVAKRKIVSTQVAKASNASVSGGEASLQLSGPEGGWLNRIASLLPLLALVAGLLSIEALQDDNITLELAEVDAELLTDDLPPAAFTDPGFAQYLRANNTH